MLKKILFPLTTFALILGLKSPSQAATFTVMTTADSGVGSLRQAIADANSTPDADEIIFLPDLTGTITLTSGELVVSQDLSINGPGEDKLTISGGNASRIFNIKSGSVSFSHLKLSDGKVVGEEGQAGKSDPVLSSSATGYKAGTGERGGEAQGGAILNLGALSLSSVLLSNNSVQGGKGGTGGLGGQRNAMGYIYTFANGDGGRGGDGLGGAIYNFGTLNLIDSSFTNNKAQGGKGGGGGRGEGKKTSSPGPTGQGGNGGDAFGGAIFNARSMTEVKTVFSGNTAVGGAAGTSSGFNMGVSGVSGRGEGQDIFEKEVKAPIVESVTLTPSPAVYNSTLKAVAKVSNDSFDFAPRLAYEWKRNGVVDPSPLTGANTYPPGSFMPRDIITVTVTAYVGTIRSEPKSASVQIWHPNFGYYLSSLTLSPASPSADAPITATATTYTGGFTLEPDYIYTWERTRAGETRNLYKSGKTLSTVGDIVIPGDIITVTVYAHYLGYTTPTRTASVTVVEFPVVPVVQNVTLSPSQPFAVDTITATVDVVKNGNLVPTLNYEWAVSRPQPEGQAPLIIRPIEKGATLSTQEEKLLVGDIVTVTVTASYGEGSSAPKSASVTIREVPIPSVRSVTLSPQAPSTDDPITATATVTDTLGNALSEVPTLSYVWTRSRKEVTMTLDEKGATLSTVGDIAAVGDVITVTVTASIGALHSEPVSASVTIVNSSLSITGVTLKPRDPYTFETMVVTVSTADADRTRPFYSYSWTRNGVVVQSTTSRSSQDSYNLNLKGRGDKGDLIGVAVTASDGETSATARASAAIRNSVPMLSSLSLSPQSPTPTQVVNANFAGRDADGDALTKVYRWKVGKKVLEAEKGTRLDLKKYAFVKAGDVVTCELRLSDGTALSKVMRAQITVKTQTSQDQKLGTSSIHSSSSLNTF